MNEEEMMEKVLPFLNKASRRIGEVSREVPEELIGIFGYLFAKRALGAFISGEMDGVSVKKELHDLIKELVNESIEQAINVKVAIEKFEIK